MSGGARVLRSEVFDLFNQHLIAAGLWISRGTIIDVTIIEAPCSIKIARKERDPETKQAFCSDLP